MSDPFDLERFTRAQEPVFAHVLAELSAGRKRSHWMWFVFPQIAGLGFSAMAQRYAIRSRAEAAAYLAHPVLGSRLVTCTGLVNAIVGRSALDVFGTPDDLKFRSSVTLFAHALPGHPAFQTALDRYFGGEPDAETMRRLDGEG